MKWLDCKYVLHLNYVFAFLPNILYIVKDQKQVKCLDWSLKLQR